MLTITNSKYRLTSGLSNYLIDLVLDDVTNAVHVALILANKREFGNTGFAGMANLVDNTEHHDMYLWGV